MAFAQNVAERRPADHVSSQVQVALGAGATARRGGAAAGVVRIGAAGECPAAPARRARAGEGVAGAGVATCPRHTGARSGAAGAGAGTAATAIGMRAGAGAGGRAGRGPKIGERGGGVVATHVRAAAFAGVAGRRSGRGPLRDSARPAPSAPNAATTTARSGSEGSWDASFGRAASGGWAVTGATSPIARARFVSAEPMRSRAASKRRADPEVAAGPSAA